VSDAPSVKVRQASAWVVWGFMLAYVAMLILELFVQFPLPIDGSTYALFMVVGGYVGIDQVASYVKSKTLPPGYKYTGSYAKLRNMVVGMMAITLLAIVVQALLPQRPLPVDNVMLAAGLIAGLFVGGNKANNAAEAQTK